MGKFLEIFNFNDIGGKIKNLAKWSCWITILLIWIASPIAFIALLVDGWTAELCWIPLVAAIVGPFFVWIGNWTMYAFGEFVEDTHAMRKKYCPMAEEQANREAEKKTNREAEEKSKHDVEKSNNLKDISNVTLKDSNAEEATNQIKDDNFIYVQCKNCRKEFSFQKGMRKVRCPWCNAKQD